LNRSIKTGKRSIPVIFPGACCAKTIVCPPVPQPMSAISELSSRLLMKLNACVVTSGLPGPCRSRFEKYSQINSRSNSWIDLFLSLIITPCLK
jgi:hypothetical protein